MALLQALSQDQGSLLGGSGAHPASPQREEEVLLPTGFHNWAGRRPGGCERDFSS